MQNFTVKTLLLVLASLLTTSLAAQHIKLTNVRAVTDDGPYSTPVWSPDGTKLLLTNPHHSKLYVMNLEESNKMEELIEGQGIGYKAMWSSDGERVIFKEKKSSRQVEIKEIDIKSKNVTVEQLLDPNVLYVPLKVKSRARVGNTVVYLNQKTLKLEVKGAGNTPSRVITKEPGQYYSPLISPDGKQVAIHEGANIYLYDMDGNTPRKRLGTGLASSWLPDGSGILTFEDESQDGHSVSGSELYLISSQSLQKTQLTSTPDVFEMWPDVSPDGKRVAFSDEKSGRIFIADINL